MAGFTTSGKFNHEGDVILMRNVYLIFVYSQKVKQPFGYAVKMDLKEIVCKDVNGIHVFRGRVQWLPALNSIFNHWVL